jgi:hypothetical protein
MREMLAQYPEYYVPKVKQYLVPTSITGMCLREAECGHRMHEMLAQYRIPVPAILWYPVPKVRQFTLPVVFCAKDRQYRNPLLLCA